jgi:hypothetical protein
LLGFGCVIPIPGFQKNCPVLRGSYTETRLQ